MSNLFLKEIPTNLALILGVSEFGLISTFYPITNEDFWPQTQQIGPTSRYKAALKQITIIILHMLIRLQHLLLKAN